MEADLLGRMNLRGGLNRSPRAQAEHGSKNLMPKEILVREEGALSGRFAAILSCHHAAFSGTLPSMEAEIDDKLPSNSS
jgi:hypothetical protein